MADAKVTLAHKKNLRDAEANKPSLLAKIKAASGVDYTFECEPKFEEFTINLIKGGSGFHEKVGDGFYGPEGYLSHVATDVLFFSFEKACKDDMIKEAIVEATPNKKIVLNLVSEEVPDDKLIQIKDGSMHLFTTPKYFNTWMRYYSQFDLTKIL